MPSKASKKARSAKKSAGKQQDLQAASKFTIPPPSRCVTRAASAAARAGFSELTATPPVVIPDQGVLPPVVSHQSLVDLENRFDTRISQLETSIRSALVASVSRPVASQPPVQPVIQPPAQPVVQPVVQPAVVPQVDCNSPRDFSFYFWHPCLKISIAQASQR